MGRESARAKKPIRDGKLPASQRLYAYMGEEAAFFLSHSP